MRWTGIVAHLVERKGVSMVLVEKSNGKDHLGGIGLGG
jgi:hypothetical protein